MVAVASPPRLKPFRLIRFGRSIWTGPDPPLLPMRERDLNAQLRHLVRSGQLADARRLFDAMPHRDEVAYATLLAGHAAAADFPGAMALFARLRASAQPIAAADPFVLSLAFKACAAAAAADAELLPHAAVLHAFAVRSSAVSSVFVSTALADAYAKSGRLELALKVFDEMPTKNVVSWTTLVASLARAGRRHDALRRFAEMRASGVACDSHAYAAALTACSDAGLLSRGREMHALCSKLGLDATPYVANTLAKLYSRCGDVDRALAAVSRMGSRDVAAWTTLIAAYVQTGSSEEAIEAFVRMLHDDSSNSASPNEYTFSAVIAACANIASVCLGEQLHAQAAHRGFAHARSVTNSLVKLYARAGHLSAADAVFRESIGKDVVSWSAIISGYAQEGLAEEAFALFAEMRHHSGCPRPNEFTLASLLSVCASAAALDAGRQLHALAVAAGLEHHAMVRSVLIDMYGKSGSMSDADVVFSHRIKDDVISWTAMIVGYAAHGHSKEALELFEEMCRVGLKPDHVTFIGVLTACCHTGKAELGLRYLNAMSKNYGLEPAKEHYGCMVDLLGKAGRIHEAEELIGRIAADERDGVVWTSLLRACAARGEEETGKKAAERAMEAEPWGAGAHVAMANLYAGKGQWREAAQERHTMKQKGVVKGAGWSSVEVGGEDRGIGVFVAGDRTHPQDRAIYRMLELMYCGARMVRYIPDQLDLGPEVELRVNS
ncbi:putative pentatricopeptide repeat-containing protein At3g47840 [Phragmites australis]|uniref:putative pentatricopeptide repeat-containing protein At3g47840 n=1 Tax=Phragmites australis TaxID=29695 RepID=UPI002D7933DD|nr:putative pentatricopeptide repeat-containing protein At3g47840 [Phragmites australis]